MWEEEEKEEEPFMTSSLCTYACQGLSVLSCSQSVTGVMIFPFPTHRIPGNLSSTESVGTKVSCKNSWGEDG